MFHDRIVYPADQVFWYLKRDMPKRLTQDIKTDVVIVGGGITGLSAAQAFCQKGYSVVLLEKYYCGAGASGKSSGFVTPNSEFDLSYVARLFGLAEAQRLWEFVTSGVKHIENNIVTLGIAADYHAHNTLVVANSKKAFEDLQQEHVLHKQLLNESILYQPAELSSVIGSTAYYGGVQHTGSFGMSSYRYCQAMKDNLEKKGVRFFEETPVLRVDSKGAYTAHATITADHTIVCVDRWTSDFQALAGAVFPVQTFIMVSAPLSADTIQKIFPDQPFLVWDTDMIYQYYRLIEGNRLLIGGGNLVSAFWGHAQYHSTFMFRKLNNYLARKFPGISFDFEYMWPGLIGISRDIMPVADFSKKEPNVYYIAGATGLAWGAALGNYSAQRIIDGNKTFDSYFLRSRKMPLPSFLERIVGKRITFALSNFISLYMPFYRRSSSKRA